jgi:hypothetical protein
VSSDHSTNGGPPRTRPPWGRVPRRLRLLFGLVAALVIAIALVAPVVFRNSGAGTCARTLQYGGRRYTARRLPAFVQSIAIGTGVVSGCGSAPSDVAVRSVAGVDAAVALALPTDDTSLYVHVGTCTGVATARLLRCLERATT